MAKTEIHVQLTGTDGNVFALGAKVREALQQGGRPDLAKEFTQALFRCRSYNDALTLMSGYVVVS